MTQGADDLFLADFAKAAAAFGIGWACAEGNTATIFLGFVLFTLALRLERAVI